MKKSLGNKRRKIGDPTDEQSPNDPDHIGDITRIYGNFTDGETRDFEIANTSSTRKRVNTGTTTKTLVVSKVFDNADFGFRKITVERPLKLNFLASDERIARIEDESGFKGLATSNKKNEKQRLDEITAGKARQAVLRAFLNTLQQETTKRGQAELILDRKAFLKVMKSLDKREGTKLSAAEIKVILSALSERDENAAICRNAQGEPEADSDLRDTESVSLKENVEAYFQREVLPPPSAGLEPATQRLRPATQFRDSWAFVLTNPRRALSLSVTTFVSL